MATFDADIGMWTVSDTPEDPETVLAREAENLEVEHKAAAVAMAVADEIAALTYESEGASEAEDWVGRGNELLSSIQRDLQERWSSSAPKRRIITPRSGVDAAHAPWAVLLATDLPLGVYFHPNDMLSLRGVCYGLRFKSTSQFFLEVLATLGVPLRPNVHEPKRLFQLACRVFSELSFVHSINSIAATALGLRRDDPDAQHLCTVAGSHALNRLLLLRSPLAGSAFHLSDDATRPRDSTLAGEPSRSRMAAECLRELADGRAQPSHGVPWTAGDIDVFVGCRGGARTKGSAAVFKAVVDHATSVCKRLYCGARTHYGQPHGLALDHLQPRVLPRVELKDDADMYSGFGGHHPSQVVEAITAQGHSYEREAVALLGEMEAFPPALMRAIGGLPARLGAARPVQVERVAEILPFGYRECRLTTCSFGPAWPLPLKINVIQYSTRLAHSAPLAPLDLVGSFDLVPSRVAMRVDADLRVHFTACSETLTAISKRELRLSKWAFGPARDGSHEAVEEAVNKQLHRIFKYETYGFKMPGGREVGASVAATAPPPPPPPPPWLPMWAAQAAVEAAAAWQPL